MIDKKSAGTCPASSQYNISSVSSILYLIVFLVIIVREISDILCGERYLSVGKKIV